MGGDRVSCRSIHTWTCDQCGKEYEEKAPTDDWPISWIDVSTGSPYDRKGDPTDHPFEDLDFCSWGCCARYAFKKSDGI
jgi:hypothetical protein